MADISYTEFEQQVRDEFDKDRAQALEARLQQAGEEYRASRIKSLSERYQSLQDLSPVDIEEMISAALRDIPAQEVENLSARLSEPLEMAELALREFNALLTAMAYPVRSEAASPESAKANERDSYLSFIQESDHPLTTREIAEHFGFSNCRNVVPKLNALNRAGQIAKESHKGAALTWDIPHPGSGAAGPHGEESIDERILLYIADAKEPVPVHQVLADLALQDTMDGRTLNARMRQLGKQGKIVDYPADNPRFRHTWWLAPDSALATKVEELLNNTYLMEKCDLVDCLRKHSLSIDRLEPTIRYLETQGSIIKSTDGGFEYYLPAGAPIEMGTYFALITHMEAQDFPAHRFTVGMLQMSGKQLPLDDALRAVITLETNLRDYVEAMENDWRLTIQPNSREKPFAEWELELRTKVRCDDVYNVVQHLIVDEERKYLHLAEVVKELGLDSSYATAVDRVHTIFLRAMEQVWKERVTDIRVEPTDDVPSGPYYAASSQAGLARKALVDAGYQISYTAKQRAQQDLLLRCGDHPEP